jgi:hypothetical protein
MLARLIILLTAVFAALIAQQADGRALPGSEHVGR